MRAKTSFNLNTDYLKVEHGWNLLQSSSKFYMMKSVLIVLCVLLASSVDASEKSLRCRRILRWTKICEASCKFLGHDSGACTPEKKCFCSGNEYEFFDQVKDWIDEYADLDIVTEKMKEVYEEVKNEVTEWAQPIAVSRCQVGAGFCDDVCKATGRVSGSCNEDFTDCTCSDETVSFDKFKYCASSRICRLKCQKDGKPWGTCGGDDGWTCQCTDEEPVTEAVQGGVTPRISNGEVEETTSASGDESIDPNSEVELLRGRRSVFGF